MAAALTPQHAGYATITSARGVREWDTQTCAHCNRVFVVRSSDPAARPDPGGWCRLCSHSICGSCADRGGCTPFERVLETYERRQAFLRAVGID